MSDKLQEIKEKNKARQNLIELTPSLYGVNERLLVNENSWLIEQLEQAQRESDEQYNHNLKLSHDLDADSNREQIKMLSEHVEDLKAQLEQAQAANQKLVECLEWYRTASESEFHRDCGDRAMYVLREVKESVGDS